MHTVMARGTRKGRLALIAWLLGAIALPGLAGAQAGKPADQAQLWTVLVAPPAREAREPEWVRPARGQPISLDFEAMRKLLAGAPWEDTDRARQNPLVIVDKRSKLVLLKR